MMEFAGIKLAAFFPGRVRFKIPDLKGDAQLAERVVERLGAVPGINSIDAKPETGSVVVRYQRDALRDPAAQHALYRALADLFPDKDLDGLEGLIQSKLS